MSVATQALAEAVGFFAIIAGFLLIGSAVLLAILRR